MRGREHEAPMPDPLAYFITWNTYGTWLPGGAICSILLNLPCHPPHAVTCLDGYPLTKQGKGGTALAITVIASFVGASWGITEMIFLAPILVQVALKFGPAEICSLMLLDEKGREIEAERVRSEDVEQQPDDHRHDAGYRPRAADPVG